MSGRVVSWVGSGIGSMVWYGMVWYGWYGMTKLAVVWVYVGMYVGVGCQSTGSSSRARPGTRATRARDHSVATDLVLRSLVWALMRGPGELLTTTTVAANVDLLLYGWWIVVLDEAGGFPRSGTQAHPYTALLPPCSALTTTHATSTRPQTVFPGPASLPSPKSPQTHEPTLVPQLPQPALGLLWTHPVVHSPPPRRLPSVTPRAVGFSDMVSPEAPANALPPLPSATS